MPYVDPDTIAVINPGDPIPAAWTRVVRDDLEFLIDPPACSVFNSGAQSVATGAGFVLLFADSGNFDNDGMHDPVTNNPRLTIQTPGRYLVQAIVTYDTNSTGSRGFRFRVNGTGQNGTGFSGAPATTIPTLYNASKPFSLAAGDFVEVEARQTSGGNLDITLSEFNATLLTR